MRRLRRSKDWSQEELAHQSGIHRTYISDLERGARNPTIEVVDKIAVALGVPCGELLD
ncbi:helix-turn-helix transcriptional regulator [Ruegeria sp. Ofav3-42]|nr:helix-turn-helix transcriptional regulator [Ruegeria sp. Ofav3-42]